MLDMEWWRQRWTPEAWRAVLLDRTESEQELEAIRRATYTGRPLGSKEFIAGLEVGSDFSKRPGSHDYRIHGSPQQSHNEAIHLIEPADIAAARLSRNLETDYSVECACEVANYVGSIVKRGESQISAIEKLQFLR